jgi:hypothetical protein
MYLLLNHDKNLKHDKNHPLHITQTKTMAVVTRMMKNVSSQVTDQFLCLLEVDDATSGGSSGVAEWAVPTQNQMTYFF